MKLIDASVMFLNDDDVVLAEAVEALNLTAVGLQEPVTGAALRVVAVSNTIALPKLDEMTLRENMSVPL
jgi:hypothetical protein